jgi:UDP-GlcNAc:undecaprenyl-phosphate GlcNAc-1-phosphate transferase
VNTYLLAFLVSLTCMLLICRGAARAAAAVGLVDVPNDPRKRHRGPIPRVGGPTILVAVTLGLAAAALMPTAIGAGLIADQQKILTTLALAAGAMLIGLLDDLSTLRPWQKLALQVLLAFAVWCAGFRVAERWAAGGGITTLGALSLPVTMLWVVGITNAFNLIDGADGLAAGAALFATSALLVASLVQQQPATTIVLATLAGATLGFLRFNFFPATVFLGDSGSLLLGFLLALVGLDSAQKSSTAFAVAVPVVAVGLPVLDTTISIVRRAIAGVHIFKADRHHVHHRLMDRGLSPRDAVILLYGVSGLFGLCSLLFLNPSGKRAGLALAVLGACVWFGIRQLRYPEMAGLWDHLATRGSRRALTSSVVARRLTDDLMRAASAADVHDALEQALASLGVDRADLYLANPVVRRRVAAEAERRPGLLRVGAEPAPTVAAPSGDARVIVAIPVSQSPEEHDGTLVLGYRSGQWVVGLPPLKPDLGEALAVALSRVAEPLPRPAVIAAGIVGAAPARSL